MSLGLMALGFLGALATIVTLAAMYPAGNPELTTPPASFFVAAGVFVLGGGGYVGFGSAIVRRLRALHGESAQPAYGAAAGFSALSALWRFVRTGNAD